MSIKPVPGPGGRPRYVVRWRESGRGSPQRQRTFDRKEDAEFFDASRRRAKQLGQLAHELIGSEQTLDDFVDEWWEKYATVYLRPGTLLSYAPVLDRWILPYLGRIRLRDLSRESVDAFLAAMRSEGAGAPTLNRARAILQGILRRAVEWRRLASNPVAGVPRFAHIRDERIDAREPETIEAVRAKLLSGFDWTTSEGKKRHFAPSLRDAALVSVLAYEGLRPAEAFALEWRDVFVEGRTRQRLVVQRALSGREVSTTKSTRSREPELFSPLAAELAQLHLLNGRPPLRSLVFPNARGGYLSRHNWRAKVWIPVLAATRIPFFRVYDLRHSAATLLIYEGRTPIEVAQFLGHADASITARVYLHTFKDAAERRRVPVADAIVRARSLARSALG